MLLLARISSIFAPLALVGLLAWLLGSGNFYVVLAGASALIILSVWHLGRSSGRLKGWQSWSFYFFKGLLFLASALMFFVFLEDWVFKASWLLLTAAVLFFYYQLLFHELFLEASFRPEAQAFFSNFVDVTAVFLFSAAIFGLNDFLNYPVGWLVSAVFLLIWLIAWFNGRLLSIASAKSVWLENLAVAVVLAEIFWALSSLALVFYLKGLIFSLIYLAVIVSLSDYLKERQKGLVKKYLFIIGFLIILLLLTARWF